VLQKCNTPICATLTFLGNRAISSCLVSGNAFNPRFLIGEGIYIPKAKESKKVVAPQCFFISKALHVTPLFWHGPTFSDTLPPAKRKQSVLLD